MPIRKVGSETPTSETASSACDTQESPVQPGIDPHRHAEERARGRGHEAQFKRRRHLFEDDLPDRPRLLVGEAEIRRRAA